MMVKNFRDDKGTTFLKCEFLFKKNSIKHRFKGLIILTQIVRGDCLEVEPRIVERSTDLE